MNEFIEQFLVECRELVAQATDDLLALEEQPEDRERLDSAFRGFHTLKGAAGIVEFDAMGRALHAAEDVLSSVRAGAEPVTAQLVGDCLTCLDQLVQWLDAMEANGDVPAGADAEADVIVARFAAAVETEATPGPATPTADWLAQLTARHPRARAASALRYTPDADSFFRGEDPLARLAELPGLVALDISPAGPWPPLDDFDPFACQVVFEALFSLDADDLAVRLAALGRQVEIRGLAPRAESGLPAAALALIEGQVLLLADASAEPGPGRAVSARRVAANVLRALGRDGEASRLDQAPLDQLPAALDRLLSGAPPVQTPEAAPENRTPQDAAPRALRVDVERIDALVNLTGELTVAKNALLHAAELAASGDDAGALPALLKAQHAQLDRLVGELQRSVLHIRVLPLRHVFQRFPRLVREMVVSLGKPAHLVTEGDETEADKAIVESLFEPLLHILRNAMDHGVESPDERTRAGKPPAAAIRLRAARQGEHVVIEVEDDGRGVDLARVRQIAVERGVAPAERLAEMADDEVLDLIFAPGFSTAGEVTSLSGRGVGMDAVRTSIERLGGRVDLTSRPGAGTKVRLILPFTVMMSRLMTVEAGGQLFGIPLEAVVETVRVPRDRIQPVGAARAFILRERTIPLIDLGQALGEADADDRSGDAHVVVAMAGGHIGGLEVDRLGDRMDVMLKPMEGLLSGMPGIAGTTLLGDGRVLLVLDLQELLE